MAKIFEWDARKGSFIEGVSKTAMTPTAVTFNRTEKGLAGVFNGSTSKILYAGNSFGTADFSVVAWCRPLITATELTIYGSNSTGNFAISIRNNKVAIVNSNVGIKYISTKSVDVHKDNHIVYERTGTNAKLIINGVTEIFTDDSDYYTLTRYVGSRDSASLFSGYISKVSVYNHYLSSKEIELDYRDFLQSQITEKPVRGFELVKPTDLSHQKTRGLFAAYNFKRNGNTLVDISGNGYNFTIEPGAVERDSGIYFPQTRASISPSITFPGGSKTVCWRGIIHDIPGSYARIYGSYIMFNSALAAFYFRAASDTTVQISTGFTTAQYGKEFDFVYIQEGSNSQKLYIDGVLIGTASVTTTTDQLVGEINSTSTGGVTTHKDLRFYTRAFTENEVKQYHNYWVKPVLLIDFSNEAVGNTI